MGLYATYAPVTQNMQLWPVQVGDYIQIQSAASPSRITKIISNFEVETLSPNTSGLTGVFTADFRIMRSPRPVAGEDIILLPEDVVIAFPNLPPFAKPPPPPAPPFPLVPIDFPSIIVPDDNGRYDILFTPSGAVTGNTARLGKIILWVRDLNENPTTARQQALITVYSQSGAVASYDVNTSVPTSSPQAGIWYSFTYDSRPSGF